MDIKKKLNEYLNSYLTPIEERKSFKSILGKSLKSESFFQMEDSCCARETSIDEFISQNKEEETFQTKLFKYIDNKGLKDSDVYNKVNIDRRLFSKIRSNKDYHPSKETIILLGFALELKEYEIEELLSIASYSLPMNTKFDLIIRFCFKEGIYDINQINEFLYDHNCRLLSQ
jgi:hypothetical protein